MIYLETEIVPCISTYIIIRVWNKPNYQSVNLWEEFKIKGSDASILPQDASLPQKHFAAFVYSYQFF